jgi:uncharacterized DUF497 family protein
MSRNAKPISSSTIWTSPTLTGAFFDQALIQPSHSKRWRAIGKSGQGIVAVVFFALGTEAVSVISMRPANKNERKLHAQR